MRPEQLRELYLKEYGALKSRPRRASASGSRHLVLGLATNLGKADIEVFVHSLRGCGYRDAIALFVTHVDARTRDYCRRHGVTLVHSLSTLHSGMSLMLLRFLLYYDFLVSRIESGHAYDRVLLTDVSDVVFQQDPFRIETPDALTVFSEGAVTIGECPVNGGWMKYTFGEEAFERCKGEAVFCAGTTMGPTDDILDYLVKMMLGSTNANPGMLSEHGVDQAIHNYLIHSGWLPDCVRSENGDIVLTVHYHVAKGLPLHTLPDGRICDAVGRIIPVLHQYTRLPTLRDRYREMHAKAA